MGGRHYLGAYAPAGQRDRIKIGGHLLIRLGRKMLRLVENGVSSLGRDEEGAVSGPPPRSLCVQLCETAERRVLVISRIAAGQRLRTGMDRSGKPRRPRHRIALIVIARPD